MSRARAAQRKPADAAPLFAALGDATRLRLLKRLCADGPGSIAQLSTHARVSRQAITKHLEVLDAAGLVRSHREGRERIWRLCPDRLDDAHAFLDRISTEWDEALERLRALVER
ncbi:MAG: metalloregulator ArsR/SmtB family transcription factor [Deltaproteobacteria bacterium]|nr:metalloregulator ArsR/SmtB family transcription factor [Deltaproteobacteria bacterium]